MENQNQNPPMPPVEPQQVIQPEVKKNISPLLLGFAVLFLLLLGVSGGYILGMSKSNKVSTSISVSPTMSQVSPTPIPDPTADWIVYSNANYGYSLKYPADSLVNVADICVVPTDYHKGEFRLFMKTATEEKTLQSSCNTLFPPISSIFVFNVPPDAGDIAGAKVEDLTINNIAFKKYTETILPTGNAGISSPFSKMIEATATVNGKTLTITLQTRGNQSDDIPDSLFDQILSTFKFTN